MSLEQRLREMGLELPPVPVPVAAYVPGVQAGQLIFTSGQLPSVQGELRYKGRLGLDLSVEEGYEAARLCAINALAVVKELAGDLAAVERIVKVVGYVNCTDDFTQQPQVINGASELLVELFGPAGRHARAAVGVNTLPLGAAVELDMIVQVRAQ